MSGSDLGTGWAPYPGQQTKFFTAAEDEVFYGGAGGGGKLLALDTMIPVPGGWSQNGDLSVGDEVLSMAGLPVRIVALSPVSHDEDAYRLSFSDGTSIIAGERHLWATCTRKEREAQFRRTVGFRDRRRAGRKSRAISGRDRTAVFNANSKRTRTYKDPPAGGIRTTREIVESLRTAKGETNHSISQHLPLDLPSADLPIPPYTLGAWLGDGSSSGGQISSGDPEILEMIVRDGFVVTHSPTNKFHHGILRLKTILRSSGVLGNKHIPSTYLRSSHVQRLALLQGLMDTDGWCEKDGSCKIALTRKELFDGVVELLRTLGIVVSITSGMKTATNGTPGNSTRCWQACFVTELPVFRLKRKLCRQNTKPHPRYLRRYVVAAENLGPLPMRCIQIANPDGMYLAGDQFIPTHNSLLGMLKFCQQLVVEHQRFKKGEIKRSKAWGLFLRRKTTDLEQMVDESHEYFKDFDSKAHFDGTKSTWNFPSCGNAKFQFDHMQHVKDRFRYKSSAFTYIFPDELTEFEEIQYLYIKSRLRSKDPVLVNMLQICSGSNPDGPGLLWVRDRFIEGKEPERVYRTMHTLEDGRVKELDTVFIPARLKDNPALYESGQYELQLRGLPQEIQEAILNGNWYYASGAYLARVWDSKMHVCPNHAVPSGLPMWRSMDYGYSAPGSCTWWYLDRDRCLTAFYNLYLTEHTPEMWAARIQEVEEELDLWDENNNCSRISGPLDLGSWDKQNSKVTIATRMAQRGVRFFKSRKGPNSRINSSVEVISRMRARVKDHDGNEKPLIRWMERCGAPIRTLPVLRPDPNNMEDVDGKGDDHCWDETRYMCAANPLVPAKEKDEDEDEVDNVRDIRSGSGRVGVGSWGRKAG